MIHVGDGSWNLKVFITDLQIQKTLRVKGDLHIGGVMLKLADKENPKDWSDHALWWPAKNTWVTRTRSTLDQVGLHADALLHYTPMHKVLRVQLPDLRYLDCYVDYSIKTFSAVVNLCKDLDIRHPEELSFCKPLEQKDLKRNYIDQTKKKIPTLVEQNGYSTINPASDTNSFIMHHSQNFKGSSGSLDKSFSDGSFSCAPVTQTRYSQKQNNSISTPFETWKNSNNEDTIFNSPSAIHENNERLASSPRLLHQESKARLVRPKTLVERARINVSWLDSSLSIMEQGVRELDTLCLRFKYYTFFDINPKYDQVRINQLYEQAKWQILNEEIDCTEEEMLMFASLQLQIALQNNIQQPNISASVNLDIEVDDDIDAALSELQITLEGPHAGRESNDITHIPELTDYLRFLRQNKFTLKGYKRYFFIYKDLQLVMFKHKDEAQNNLPPSSLINLRGCEVTPEVILAQNKFNIKLEVPPESGNGPNSEMWIRCDNEEQYAKWMAACRLASKGRSLADSSYESEVKSIQSFLNMQKPGSAPAISIDPDKLDANDFVAPRFVKKMKNRASYRILEAHTNVKHLSLIDSKIKFIQAWQSLPEYGVTLFVIKFVGHKKEELLGIAHNRMMKMDLSNGDHLKTWRYNTMKAWNVNWEIKCMMVQLQDENIMFSCLSADCKVIHEFIGGYIFMSMRSKETNQTLNEEMFHKLTGGWT